MRFAVRALAIAAEQRHYLALSNVQGQSMEDVADPVVRVHVLHPQDHAATPPR